MKKLFSFWFLLFCSFIATTAPWVATPILIPSGTTARISYLTDGIFWVSNPGGGPGTLIGTGGYSINSSTPVDIITAVSPQNPIAPPLALNIYNPSQLGGLPNQIQGVIFTGLAIGVNSSYAGEEYCMSFTNGSHNIITAELVGMNYIVSNNVVVNAPFAPAASGFVLHKIELLGNRYYGLFSKPGGIGTTYLAQIDINTGGSILLHTFNNALPPSGMTVYDNELHILKFDDIPMTSVFGQIITFDPILMAVTNISDLNIPFTHPMMNYCQSGSVRDLFLARPTSAADFLFYMNRQLRNHVLNSGTTTFESTDSPSLLWNTSNNSFNFVPGIRPKMGYIISDCATFYF